jgi:triosephosphate isomerase
MTDIRLPIRTLIAGNWKMNGSLREAALLVSQIEGVLADDPNIMMNADLLVCAPHVHLHAIGRIAKGVMLGAQDCSDQDVGAYTGQVSASMLKDVECTHVILGHSERRDYNGESDALVAAKAKAAHRQDLTTIICVGETEEQREAGEQQAIVAAQLKGSIPDTASVDNLVIAYEPVWAIGTGKTATPEDAGAMHDFIRGQLADLVEGADSIAILYGGSVTQPSYWHSPTSMAASSAAPA